MVKNFIEISSVNLMRPPTNSERIVWVLYDFGLLAQLRKA